MQKNMRYMQILAKYALAYAITYLHIINIPSLFLLFVKELLAAEDASSVFITTVNKEKYRCSLPFVSKTSDKASVCVICETYVLYILLLCIRLLLV